MQRIPLLVTLLLPALALAQGSLTPPATAFSSGAPTSTMKSLDQIEPRIPLEVGSPGVSLDMNGGFIIENSGSYYLTGPLEVGSGNAINIYAPDVTLDLRGFTISSTADDAVVRGTAIFAPNIADHLVIRNGHISGTIIMENNGTFTGRGFDHGIDAPSTSGVNQAASNTLVENITVEGVMKNGISLDRPTSLIRSCSVYQCGQFGLLATDVADSNAAMCGSIALLAHGTASNCTADGQRGGLSAVTAINCSGRSGTDCGLAASVATNCQGESYSATGLMATKCATGCVGVTTTGPCGLRAGNDSPATPGTAENCRGEILGTTTATTTGLIATTATNCVGLNRTGIGLSAENATGCKGTGGSGIGLYAEVATGCKGASNTGIGLQAVQTATGCFGTTVSGVNGLLAGSPGNGGTAENCRGIVTGTGATGTGLSAETASNCFGQGTASTGLYANTASNCSAYTATGAIAMDVAGSATNCRGNNGGGGTAIRAAIAVSCTTANGAILGNKQLGTP